MDPINTLMTVCKMAMTVKHWLDDQKDKDATMTDLAMTVTRIHDILSPFQAPSTASRFDHTLLDSIRGIGDILTRTQEHLVASEEKLIGRLTAFFKPTVVVQQLRDDEKQLSQQLIIMLFAMSVLQFVGSNPAVSTSHSQVQSSLVLSSIGNQEVKQFWRDYVGAKVGYVPADKFRSAIKPWFKAQSGQDLNNSACDHLLLCLDEFGIGGITSSGLENFLGSRGLKETLLQFQLMGNHVMPSTGHSNRSFDLQTPLIVWVDDNTKNNLDLVAYARSRGITVVEILSTASAKAWIEANQEFLRQNDRPNRVRFISDNARWEGDPHAGTFLNMSAGENILRYLRGRFFAMPVLIYCGASIPVTRYVRSFEMAGSTNYRNICKRYISALADGTENDSEWKRFSAS